MTVWIILFWVVGVGLIVGIAVYRGIKNGPTKFAASPLEEVQQAQERAKAESAATSEQLQMHMAEMRAEIQRLNRKIDSLRSEQAETPTKKADRAIEELQERLALYNAEGVNALYKVRERYTAGFVFGNAESTPVSITIPEVVHATAFEYEGKKDRQRAEGDEPTLRLGLE